MKLVELLEKKGFIPDLERVKEVEESLEEIKKWSRLKSYQIYRGKRRYPTIVVNPYTDESFWDYKRNFINIGILSYGAKAKAEISLRELVLSLLGHELSHTENTPLPKETWSNEMRVLFNILEDQRIETLMSERIGKEVFEKANARYYELYYEGKRDPHLNPFNIVILKRWERWGVKVNWEYLKEADGELKEALERGFLEDAESTLIAMESIKQGEEASSIAEAFYQRWRNLFENEEFQTKVIDPLGGKGEVEGFEGLSEEAKEEIEKQLEEVQSENPFGNGNNGKATPYGGEKHSRWLTDYSDTYKPQRKEVEKWKRKLRKLFKGGKKVKERAWIGNKIDPKVVISGIPKPPSWRKRGKSKREKVSVIIDGSASMAGNAFQEAVNIAQAIKELEEVEIFITTSEGLTKVKGNTYPFPGGGTALTVAKPYLKGYRIAVITDGFIDEMERKFLKEVEKNKGFIFFV